ncbi:MAG: hypothetical protein PUC97_00505 [bacterium]|nr:hypothetical protein [bacterium]
MKKDIFKNCGIRYFALVLLFLLLMVIGTETSFAESSGSDARLIPGNAPSNEITEFDPTNVNVISESQTRGANPPTKLFDLSNSNYSVSGSWRYLIYTSYYFYPNAEGKLHWNFTVELADCFVNQTSFTVDCWDKTTNRKVTSTTFYSELQPNGAHGLYISTGNWNTYNLDPSHKYYFAFLKTNDATEASITGTIRH